MQTAQVRSIASLKRGLDVLSLVQSSDGLLLRELHAGTGVPKASLLRILKTLIEHRLVRRRDGDGAYLSTTVSTGDDGTHGALITQRGVTALSATPRDPLRAPTDTLAGLQHALADALPELLATLHQQLPWPSDVAVSHGLKMRVIDSNRALYGRLWRPSVIGESIDSLDSAMGRAYLAFSPQALSRPLVDALLAAGGFRARRKEALQRELLATRQRGFGARDDLYAGPDSHHGRQLSAIAVPILHGDWAIACLSCVWSQGTSARAEVIEQALAHLVRGASVLGERLKHVR